MRTILLLIISNTFMTVAWYGHLRRMEWPLWQAVLVSWGIAFFEYALMVPANRFGVAQFSVTQLKVIQEVITLSVFSIFAMVVLREPWKSNYAISFLLLIAAVYFAFKR